MNSQYDSFNDALMQNINPAPSSNTAAEPAGLTGSGILTVQVCLAKGALPLEGATVIISKSDGDKEIEARLVTDKSGRTPPDARPVRPRPAPSAVYSQTPGGNTRPYSIYNITAELPGYYPESMVNVPIFDKITSIQPIVMIPLSEQSVRGDELYINESPQI